MRQCAGQPHDLLRAALPLMAECAQPYMRLLGAQAFDFDRAFPPSASQAEVFEDVSPLVTSALDGYNVCIFAYGQTGARAARARRCLATRRARASRPRALKCAMAAVRGRPERRRHASQQRASARNPPRRAAQPAPGGPRVPAERSRAGSASCGARPRAAGARPPAADGRAARRAGAGKTHTMLGTAEDPGINFRTMRELFRCAQPYPAPPRPLCPAGAAARGASAARPAAFRMWDARGRCPASPALLEHGFARP
jgi:hypothetical protein